MRATVRESQTASPGVESYPAGSVVLCQGCLKPLYRLERGIGVGESAGRSVDAYRPVQPKDIHALMASMDPGVVASLNGWSPAMVAQHCQGIPTLRAGAPALCPCCGQSFVRVRATDAGEVLDRAYVLELVTIPPGRQIRGKEARTWVK